MSVFYPLSQDSIEFYSGSAYKDKKNCHLFDVIMNSLTDLTSEYNGVVQNVLAVSITKVLNAENWVLDNDIIILLHY